jgi:RNA polymerase sigma factor (sigma-70 family)
MPATEMATRASRALDDLYRAHVGEVYRYTYAVLGNHADAEDVTQTTFVNALRALERGERPRKPSNWLIAIAHNVVRQRFRTQQARPAEVELLDHDIPVEDETHDGPTLDELVKALQRIPPTQREAIVMRELEGRSYKEIQQILELTPTALEMLLFRARRSLAEELENVVTCEQAELAMSRRLDGRLSRKERRRLLEHLAECPSCARLDACRKKRGRAFGALAVLPLPLSLTFFKGVPSASAATGLPTIGTGAVAAAGGGSAGTTGGLLATGVAFKAVALVAAVAAAGAVGYQGVTQVRERTQTTPPITAAMTSRPAAGRPAEAQAHHKKAIPAQPTTVPIPPVKSGAADGPKATAKPSGTLSQQAEGTAKPDGTPETDAATQAPSVAGTPTAEQQQSHGTSAGTQKTTDKAVTKPVKKAKKPRHVKKPKPAHTRVVPAQSAAPAQTEETAPEAAPSPAEPSRASKGAALSNAHP